MMKEEHSHRLDQLLEMFLREWKEHRKTVEKNNPIRCVLEVIEERRGLKPALKDRVRRKHRRMQSVSEIYRAFEVIHLISTE